MNIHSIPIFFRGTIFHRRTPQISRVHAQSQSRAQRKKVRPRPRSIRCRNFRIGFLSWGISVRKDKTAEQKAENRHIAGEADAIPPDRRDLEACPERLSRIFGSFRSLEPRVRAAAAPSVRLADYHFSRGRRTDITRFFPARHYLASDNNLYPLSPLSSREPSAAGELIRTAALSAFILFTASAPSRWYPQKRGKGSKGARGYFVGAFGIID